MLIKKTGYPLLYSPTWDTRTEARCPTCYTLNLVVLKKLNSWKTCHHCKKSFNTTAGVMYAVNRKKLSSALKLGNTHRAGYVTNNFISLFSMKYQPRLEDIFYRKSGEPVFDNIQPFPHRKIVNSIGGDCPEPVLSWEWNIKMDTAAYTSTTDQLATSTNDNKVYSVHLLTFARDPLMLFEARVNGVQWFVNIDLEYTLHCIEAHNPELLGTLFLFNRF